MPAHLVVGGRLIEDPAAVMEALLLEDKFEDSYEKISGEKRIFSLEHMFYKEDLTDCHRHKDNGASGRQMKPSVAAAAIPHLIQVPSHLLPSPLFYMRPNQPNINSFNPSAQQNESPMLVRELSNDQPGSSTESVPAQQPSAFNYVEMIQRYYQTLSKQNQINNSQNRSNSSIPQNQQPLAYPLNNVRISIQNEPQLDTAINPAVAPVERNTALAEAHRLLISKLQDEDRKNKRKTIQPTRRFSQQDPQSPLIGRNQPNLTVTPPHNEEGVDRESNGNHLSPKMITPRTLSSEGESELLMYLSSPNNTSASSDGGSSVSS